MSSIRLNTVLQVLHECAFISSSNHLTHAFRIYRCKNHHSLNKVSFQEDIVLSFEHLIMKVSVRIFFSHLYSCPILPLVTLTLKSNMNVQKQSYYEKDLFS